MGISIGICETDSKSALCKDLRLNVIKVRVDDISGIDDIADYDEVVSLDDARSLVEDWDAFMKRNRINAETDAIYMDKLKNDDDIELFSRKAKKISTGWVDMNKVDPSDRNKIIDLSKKENRMTGWDMLSFDDMKEMCLKCPLSWDKGRGCIGSFGPDNGLLPDIARRRGCAIVASVPDGAKTGRIYTPKEASELLKEIEILTAALPEEGKVMVRRYGGALERMGAVAKISADEDCGFYFF